MAAALREAFAGEGGHLRISESEQIPEGSRPWPQRSMLICGDAQRSLRLLPDGCVQTVVTSPPYWSLRDYASENQIGRNDVLSDYVTSIVSMFANSCRT